MSANQQHTAECGCAVKHHEGLRCWPATELEIHRMQRARETGKSKPPSWWKRSALPATWQPDFRRYLPIHCRRGPGEVQSDTWLDMKAYRQGMSRKPYLPTDSLLEYIRAYEEQKGLRHVKLVAA